MIVHPEDIEIAKKLLHNSINIYEFKNDDCWARDSGATFLINDQGELIEEWRKVKVKGHAQAVLDTLDKN